MGKNVRIGAPFSNSNNILQVDKLFNNFANSARKSKVSELLIGRMKSLSALAGIDIQSCRTDDSRVNELMQCLKKNPKNIMLQVDKSPDLIYVKKCEYFEKINEFFGDNFELLPNYTGTELENDIEA
jgi:hypothetical protein